MKTKKKIKQLLKSKNIQDSELRDILVDIVLPKKIDKKEFVSRVLDVIYCTTYNSYLQANDYLKEFDPSFIEGLGLAVEEGYDIKDIDSLLLMKLLHNEALADLLIKEMLALEQH